jgi:hypothetical protein
MAVLGILPRYFAGQHPPQHGTIRFDQQGSKMSQKGHKEQDKANVMHPGGPKQQGAVHVPSVDIFPSLDQPEITSISTGIAMAT